jgi:hypothetical protein
VKNKDISEIKDTLLKDMLLKIDNAEKLMYYNNKPYTNSLKKGMSDAKLKYFNAEKYF